MERERSAGSLIPIPKFIASVIERLSKEGVTTVGLFRTSGNHVVVSELKHQVDRGVEVSIKDIAMQDLASLLKKYLSELPEPLITYELYDILIVQGRNRIPLRIFSYALCRSFRKR